MASFVGVLATCAILCAVVAYGAFVLKRFGGSANLRLSGWKRALLWASATLAVALFGFAILGLGHMLGVIYCSAGFSAADPWPCTLGGRLLFLVVSIGVGLPLVVTTIRLVGRVLAEHSRV